jgi:hypothetical protein
MPGETVGTELIKAQVQTSAAATRSSLCLGPGLSKIEPLFVELVGQPPVN